MPTPSATRRWPTPSPSPRGSGAHLVLFHHGPQRTDDALDGIAQEFGAVGAVVVAREGMVLDLP